MANKHVGRKCSTLVVIMGNVYLNDDEILY